MLSDRPVFRLVKGPLAGADPFTGARKSLAEVMVMLASEMEEAMIAAGAKAEIDYDYKSLFALAAPFAQEVMKSNGRITIGM